jgi:hypothetical protein
MYLYYSIALAMNKVLITLIAFAALFTGACKKDNNHPSFPFIVANKQNVSWVAQPSCYFYPNRDSLSIRAYHPTGEENLFITIRFNGRGTYNLKAGQARFYTTIGQDVETSRYALDTTLTSTLTVTEFNLSTNVMKGNFQVNLVKVYDYGGSSPNKLSFTNGEFWMSLPSN